MLWRSILSLGAVLLLVCLTAASSQADELSYFKKQLEPFRHKPTFVAPGPPFNAKECMKGKTIFSIPVSSVNPFTANIEKSMADVAAKVGFKLTIWQNQGQISQWVQGMNAAMTEKPTLIDMLGGTDPRVLVPQVRAAKAAGIPVVASHYSGLEQWSEVHKMGVDQVPIAYFKAGALLVDWAGLETKGKLNAIVLISTGPLSTDSMMAGLHSELKHCPGCKIHVINVPVVDWGTRITPDVRSALLSDPSINYIIIIYDSMAQFVVPAVTLTNSANRIKFDSFNGTPFVIGLIQQGKVQMDIGENLDWIGHAVMDAEMRIACGLPQVRDEKIPFYIFDTNNAKDAGTPPQLSKGYGNAYIEGYEKLWQLK
ncbi:MAG: sugar ABC transporter substrate-binding protein [Stellaceae bacterium]